MTRRGNPSRRGLLVTGVTAAVGLAGCIGGSQPFTSMEVDVSSSFETAKPVSVPVSVYAYVQNVDSPAVALRAVELVAYDGDRTELAAEPLGDFDRAAADDANRDREEYGDWPFSTTVYSADWTVEAALDVDAVPQWLTFRVGEVWFVDEVDDESAPGGVVSASTPPPAFTAYTRRYAGSRPPPETVAPDAFASERVERGRSVADPVLPRSSDRSGNESASGE